MKHGASERVGLYTSSSGLIGAVIMALGMLLSGFAYVGVQGQRYNLLNHFVSELGEIGVSEWAVVFNWSLVLGGILTSVFMVYLASKIKHWIKIPLGIISLYASTNGALVGIYPMNNLEPHIRVAMRFFNLGMLITFLYSLVFLFSRWHPFPRWVAIPGLWNAAAFAWFLNYPSNFDSGVSFEQGMVGILANRPDFIPLALLEWVVILGILLWVLILSGYLCIKIWSSD